MRRVYPLLIASLFWLAMTGIVQAEKGGFCVSTSEAMKAVATEKERLVFRGLSKRGHLVTIYLGPKRTFSAIVHYPNGKSCFVDFGGEGEIMGATGERS
jgi:hypothetical protein